MTKGEIEQYIFHRFDLDPTGTLPIHIPKHGRLWLAEFYRDLGFKRGAEIGVRRGEHAELMCRTVPGLELICVDPWLPQPGYLDKSNTSDKMRQYYEEAIKRLTPYGCTIIEHVSSVASTMVPDRSLDFVYIDANHREAFVRYDLEVWLPKVRSGGILAGHDYATMPEKHIEVKDAVDGFTRTRGIRPWFVLSAVKGDKTPSFFWVVE